MTRLCVVRAGAASDTRPRDTRPRGTPVTCTRHAGDVAMPFCQILQYTVAPFHFRFPNANGTWIRVHATMVHVEHNVEKSEGPIEAPYLVG